MRDAGLQIAVASSAKKDEVEKYLDIAGITDLVHLKTTSDEVEESKPAPDIFEIVLKKLKIEGADAVAIGDAPYDAEADEEESRIREIIRSAANGENDVARFWLTNTLGLMHIPDSTHRVLLDFVGSSLSWQSAIELFQDIDWDFQYSEDTQKRTGYARRSAARLQRVVALRRANGDSFDINAWSQLQLAEALAYFDPRAALAELAAVGERLPHSKMSDEDRQRLRIKIGALRSSLARR